MVQFFTIKRPGLFYSVLSGLLILTLCKSSTALIGQSAVITLSFPYGPRASAMGELGTGLADDESVMFYNPAALGLPNRQWNGGSMMCFFGPLLPEFDMPDLWHLAIAGCVQPDIPGHTIGGFGTMINYLNFGINEQTNAQGQITKTFFSYEYVYSISYGGNFDFHPGDSIFYAGIALKGAYSALAPGTGEGAEGTAATFAVDMAMLWDFPIGLRFGCMLQNMGPAVSYVHKDSDDPIPFTIRLGLAYQREMVFKNMRVFKGSAGIDLDREVVRKNLKGKSDPFWKAIYTDLLHDTMETPSDEFRQIIWHIGHEETFFNTGSIRVGYMHDEIGSRKEIHLGTGGQVLNHFKLDFSVIISPGKKMSPARNGQWEIAFTVQNLFIWRQSDLTWWLQN